MQEIVINRGSFIVFRFPGESTIYHAQILRREEFTEEGNGFVFSSFELNGKKPSILILDLLSKIENEEQLESKFNGITALKTSLESTNFDVYSNGFNTIIEAINDRIATKVVLSRLTFVPIISIDNCYTTFKYYLDFFPNALVSFVHFAGESSWCGASPELLYTVTESGSTTVALASTRKDDGANTAPSWTKKEVDEQWWVEQFVENNLKNLAINYTKTAPKSVKSGNLWHLKTVYSFNSCDSLVPFLQTMHPTPAVGGSPKIEALRLINASEQHDRRYYTGIIGPYNLLQKTALFVNIRCIEVFENGATVYTGGGITAGSHLESEWDETIIKANSLVVK